MHIIELLSEDVSTQISAPELSGLKDVISRRIIGLPDNESTQKALKEIEDLLSHVQHGGRHGAISKEISEIQDKAVQDSKKVLARLVLSIMEEVNASPEQRSEFFNLWKGNQLINIDALLSNEQVDFSQVFTGYGTNPVIEEFVNEVMLISELGMGRGEFGLNVLSRSITVAGKGSKKDNDEESGSKKGDLQITVGNDTFQIELKTEMGGAARFGDQEVRPAEGFEAAAVALNTFVKNNKAYKNLGSKLSGSGMNLNQAIAFNKIISPADSNKFLSLVRTCVSLIFGNTKGSRKDYALRLKKNVNAITAAIESGDNGEAAQQWSQASFNYYMSKKHDDGVLYTNLNTKTFIYYNDAEQLQSQGLRFHASTPYISATKDPVRSVYPQIGVQQTTRGGDAAQAGIKKIAKGKDPLNNPEFVSRISRLAVDFASRRGVKNQKTIHQITQSMTSMIANKIPPDQVIQQLEQKFPQLALKQATTRQTTPGIRNQNSTLGASKEMMGQAPAA